MAVEAPEAVRAGLEHSVVEPLRSRLLGARWTRPDGRHLTLKFLGEVPDGRVDALCQVVVGAAGTHRRFEVAFSELGAFPNARRPRVLWVGLGDGAEPMAALAAGIEQELVPLGFPLDDRPFRTHVTLARFPHPGALHEMPAVHVPTTSFVVNDVVVFRSELHPRGARYTVIRRIPLGGG